MPVFVHEFGAPDVIICCECVWRLDLVTPFLNCLFACLSAGQKHAKVATSSTDLQIGSDSSPGTFAVVAYCFREEDVDSALMKGLEQRGIHIQNFEADMLDEEFMDEGYTIFKAFLSKPAV